LPFVGVGETQRHAKSELLPTSVKLIEPGSLFLRIGATGFGGAMPMLAVVQGEVVERRRWVGQKVGAGLVGTLLLR